MVRDVSLKRAAAFLTLAALASCGNVDNNQTGQRTVGTKGEAMTAEWVDRQQIEDLQRLYAKATDTIGLATPEDVEAGRAIYHRIYTPDVNIRTSNTGADPLTASSPDEWVDVVYDALKDYTGTQHLIGTQLVDLNGDEAHMESYVNAWHKYDDGRVYFFLGTYISKARRTAQGWKIYDMNLRHDTSGTAQTE